MIFEIIEDNWKKVKTSKTIDKIKETANKMASPLSENSIESVKMTVGKSFLVGYLSGKVFESFSGRKTSYGLPLGIGSAVIGIVCSYSGKGFKRIFSFKNNR